MSVRNLATNLVLLAVAGAAVTACGRAGPPLTPYEAALEKRAEAQEAGEPVPPAREPPETDRRFILDGLID